MNEELDSRGTSLCEVAPSCEAGIKGGVDKGTVGALMLESQQVRHSFTLVGRLRLFDYMLRGRLIRFHPTTRAYSTGGLVALYAIIISSVVKALLWIFTSSMVPVNVTWYEPQSPMWTDPPHSYTLGIWHDA